jgi:hypothetical protein
MFPASLQWEVWLKYMLFVGGGVENFVSELSSAYLIFHFNNDLF